MIHVYGLGAETSEDTEFDLYFQNATVASDQVKSGSYSFKADYNLIWNDPQWDLACGFALENLPTYQNIAVHFQFRFDVAPAVEAIICLDNTANASARNFHLKLTADRKLKLTSNAGAFTGTTVLSTATWYQIELRLEKVGDGKIYLRINESDELDQTVYNLDSTAFTWGRTEKDYTGTDPAFVAWFDDIVLWIATDSEYPPWLNTCNVHYRTVDAAGTYNDYIAVGSGSKWLNVDDYATSDGNTTRNRSGTAGTTRRQTHNLANATPSGTLKGFTLFGLHKTDTDAPGEKSRYHFLLRDSGSDFEVDFATNPTTSYSNERVGYEKMPGGSDISVADVNALEVGSKIDSDASYQLHETSYWVTTIHGDAPTTIASALSKNLQVNQSVNRAGTY